MSLFTLDFEKITNAKTREYFREVVNSYNNANYRSSVVVLFSNSCSLDESSDTWFFLLNGRIESLSDVQLKAIGEAFNENRYIYENWELFEICSWIEEEFAEGKLYFDFMKYPNFKCTKAE